MCASDTCCRGLHPMTQPLRDLMPAPARWRVSPPFHAAVCSRILTTTSLRLQYDDHINMGSAEGSGGFPGRLRFLSLLSSRAGISTLGPQRGTGAQFVNRGTAVRDWLPGC